MGDGYFQKKSVDRITEFHRRGGTLLFCSHALYYVALLCDQALWLRNGQIAYLVSGGKLVVIDEKGKELRTLNVGNATGWATVESLPGGRWLIAQGNGCKAVEYDAAGKELWQCGAVANPNAASRLPNGNTLICSNNDRVIAEVNQAGKVLWQQKLEGRPFRIRRR